MALQRAEERRLAAQAAKAAPSVESVPAVVASDAPPKKTRLPIYAGIAAAVVLVAALAIYFRPAPAPAPVPPPQRSGPVTPPETKQPPVVPPTDLKPVPPADTSAVAPQLVSVDVLPWARVRIVPASANADVPKEPLVTPFTIQLPPGNYRLECENGGVSTRSVFSITVEPGRPLSLTRPMTGFNAEQVVQALLGGQP